MLGTGLHWPFSSLPIPTYPNNGSTEGFSSWAPDPLGCASLYLVICVEFWEQQFSLWHQFSIKYKKSCWFSVCSALFLLCGWERWLPSFLLARLKTVSSFSVLICFKTECLLSCIGEELHHCRNSVRRLVFLFSAPPCLEGMMDWLGNIFVHTCVFSDFCLHMWRTKWLEVGQKLNKWK